MKNVVQLCLELALLYSIVKRYSEKAWQWL